MIINKKILDKLNIENFTPSSIAKYLEVIPELFLFLKSKEKVLGRSKGIVTFITSVTVWAFKEKTNSLRNIPQGLLNKLWEDFANKDKENIFDIPHKLEPHMWNYFLSLIYLESQRGKWEKHELVRAASVYGPILIGCCWVFYSEEQLTNMEQIWKEIR